MNDEQLGSTVTFAQELAARLEAIGEPSAPLPDARALAQLVEVSFFAGLHEEEARRTELALAWTEGMKGCSAVIELARPVPATPKNIAKLAPAANRDATSLAVRPEGDGLVVWALLQHGTSRQLPLMMRLLAPGVLRADYLGVPRALYARGEILFVDEAHRVEAPARRLTEAFTCWREEAEIDARAATVTRLAARALEHGHGGMILILPANAAPCGVRMHYEVGPGAELLAAHYAALIEGAAPAERVARIAAPRGADDRAPLRYDGAIDLVAGLTATDNALLLDTDLRVRGFGVQVIEGEATLQPFRHRNPYTADMHVDDISTFKGTRHPAGVIFCLRQDGEAAAIVASQDGRLSLVTKDARGVVEVLGSYERAFGWR